MEREILRRTFLSNTALSNEFYCLWPKQILTRWANILSEKILKGYHNCAQISTMASLQKEELFNFFELIFLSAFVGGLDADDISIHPSIDIVSIPRCAVCAIWPKASFKTLSFLHIISISSWVDNWMNLMRMRPLMADVEFRITTSNKMGSMIIHSCWYCWFLPTVIGFDLPSYTFSLINFIRIALMAVKSIRICTISDRIL